MDWLGIIFVAAASSLGAAMTSRAKSRGREQWVGFVVRPKDLFADSRLNRVVNAVDEWLWIGLIVALVGAIVWIATVGWLGATVAIIGVVMMFTRMLVTPTALAYAPLAPPYEALAADAASA